MGSLTSLLSCLLLESRLRPAPVLLVGDPEVLAQGIEPSDDPFSIVSTGLGKAAVLRHPDPSGSAFVWVGGRGPVQEITAVLRLDAGDGERIDLGHLDCPSGRVVVGSPEAVAAWGVEIEPDEGLLAQARAYGVDRRHHGLVVVTRVQPGSHRVSGIAGTGGLDALIVEAGYQDSLLIAS
jgi:hypothetical protein